MSWIERKVNAGVIFVGQFVGIPDQVLWKDPMSEGSGSLVKNG